MTSQAISLSVRGVSPARLRPVWALMLGAALLLAQASLALARAAPESFADLADKVSPAVVNITTSTTIEGHAGPNPLVPEGSPFEDFFRDFMNPDGSPNMPPRRSQALGSGFLISEDGYIVTNNHVIEKADEIQIELFQGGTLEAKVVGTDPNTDIALLKVQSDKPLPFVPFGKSEMMRVGDWVMAMGNPLGQGFSVSAGIISARGRALSGTYDDFLQTDAAINKGNSGGPLFNMDGEVVGVNTAILSPTGGSIGIGFAMSSEVVANVVSQLKEFGETRRGWLGVRIQDVTPDMAEALGLDQARGAVVTDVPEGPAAEAGMQSGDVILSFDGVDVQDTHGLVRQVGNAPVGKAVRVIVFRQGKTQTLLVTLGRRETAEGGAAPGTDAPSAPEAEAAEVLGMTLVPLTDELRDQLGVGTVTDGLAVTDIDETGEAYAKGLRSGDVITEAGQRKVATAADLQERIEEARDAGRKSLLLLVRRQGEPRFVALSVAE
ncbi:Do family serine endopeptidase [Rhodovulum kholense]|uniref:Probable periplasmic serine endoprotease DegP-like n=1 Tax=Rhodovulum kholense TaxID=453584 RepID=A0A8E2VNX0_9RHOB|nr:serine protease Do [Rhodovulum kholense]